MLFWNFFPLSCCRVFVDDKCTGLTFFAKSITNFFISDIVLLNDSISVCTTTAPEQKLQILHLVVFRSVRRHLDVWQMNVNTLTSDLLFNPQKVPLHLVETPCTHTQGISSGESMKFINLFSIGFRKSPRPSGTIVTNKMILTFTHLKNLALWIWRFWSGRSVESAFQCLLKLLKECKRSIV